MYTTDYFINKFEAIPAELFYMGSIENSENPKEKCSYGHCGANPALSNQPQEAIALSELFKKHFGSNGEYFQGLDMVVVAINDDYGNGCLGAKKNILVRLYEIKGMEAVKEAEAIVSQPQTVVA